LLVSAELDEVMALADTVGVIYKGRLVATMPREEATREKLGLLMTGGTA
jgi:simple sugar transport system ATP-binding protein